VAVLGSQHHALDGGNSGRGELARGGAYRDRGAAGRLEIMPGGSPREPSGENLNDPGRAAIAYAELGNVHVLNRVSSATAEPLQPSYADGPRTGQYGHR
jgi:hypothetical protein